MLVFILQLLQWKVMLCIRRVITMQVYTLEFNKNFARPILDNGVSKVMQFSFPKGKVMKKHTAPSAILVQVISGEILFETEEEEVIVKSGELLSLEANIEHAVQALEDSVMLLTITPSPSAHKG